VLLVEQLDDPQPDIEDAVNYPNVRTFLNNMVYSDKPLEDLGSVNRQWARPSSGN
jgi:sialate O-acetylesterase